jgi:hypothetical protein
MKIGPAKHGGPLESRVRREVTGGIVLVCSSHGDLAGALGSVWSGVEGRVLRRVTAVAADHILQESFPPVVGIGQAAQLFELFWS